MATVRSTLALNDGMTPVMRRINNAMSFMVNNFVAVQEASGKAVDKRWLNETRQNLGVANAMLNEMENKYKRCENAAAGLNDEIAEGTSKADGLMGKIKGIAGAYVGMQGIKALVNLSDTQTQTEARLNLLVTDGGSVDALESKINASAMRSRSAYLDTASAVAKLGLNAGNAFDHDMDQVIAFTEQVNKQFVIGGATAQEQSNAMVQLTQAMAAGALRGEELNSILDSAPGIARAVEQYMGAAEGSIKSLAEDGKVTAQVVKNAMFATAEQTNAKFESMPMTWSQVWTQAGNIALQALNPLLTGINWLANNLPIVAPIVLGLAAALGVYFIAINRVKIAEMTSAVWTGITTAAKVIATAATWLFTKATLAQAGAQHGLNAALLACPLVWILIMIIAIIAILYAVIGIINKVTGSSISATGVIVGSLAAAGAFIWDLILGCLELVLGVINYLINPFIEIANFIGNVFTNPISSIIYLFQGMADNVLGILQKIASALDFVFGSNMADAVQGWRDGLKGKADALVAEYAPNENYSKVMDNLNLSVDGLGLKRIAYSDAYSAGYSAGESIDTAVGNMFSFDSLTKGADIPTAEQYANIAGNLDDIAGDTSSLANSSDKTTEELAYLRDIAEKEAINRFTTAEVKVELGGITNNVAQNTDLDGIISYLADGFSEALATAAEGIY